MARWKTCSSIRCRRMETFHWWIETQLESCFVTQWGRKTIDTCCSFSGQGRINYTTVCHSYYMLLISRKTVDKYVKILRWRDFWLRLQKEFHRFFLCLWNRREIEKHYTVKDWPFRTRLCSRNTYVQNAPLVKPEKAFLPPLHTNLWLIWRTLLKVVAISLPLPSQLSFRISAMPKLNAGSASVHKLEKLCSKRISQRNWIPLTELAAWKSFKSIVSSLLNMKDDNYPGIIQSLLQNYQKLAVIEIPVLMLAPENQGAFCVHQDELFIQDTAEIQQWCYRRWDQATAEYFYWWWTFIPRIK